LDCAWKERARQSDCLCITSEIVAKLFDFLRAMFFTASDVEKCFALCQECIEVLSVSGKAEFRVVLTMVRPELEFSRGKRVSKMYGRLPQRKPLCRKIEM